MIAKWLVVASLTLAPVAVAAVDDPQVSFEALDLFIEGEPYPVKIGIEAPAGGAGLPAWMLTAAAFTLDGEALGERAESKLTLLPGQKIEVTFDLAPALLESPAFERKKFRLGFDAVKEPRDVLYLEAAQRGINFMELPKAQLGEYDVILRTSAGDIWLEMWPTVAPNHVRNFLDLAYTGYYDDNQFHRAVPGFMIQGGSTSPGRAAPRRLDAEFSAKRHVPGILSMARLPSDTQDENGNIVSAVNSATCEFFVMHGVTPFLDGKYTAFGEVVTGTEAVETIATTDTKTTPPSREKSTPVVRQAIYKAMVIRAPKEKPKKEK
ncbi:MAG: peptidylprolyl isomerase [bacterium]|nr:peptidylprolyl isomerase [bacterium]